MAYTDSQRRQHILELQKYLHSISLFNDNILTITPDGVYGKDTAEAVRNFQREYGLPQTGNTDLATWNKVVGIYRGYINAAPIPYRAFPSRSYTVRNGDSGQIVYIIQAMLDDLSAKYDNMPRVEVGGNYTPQTAAAIRNFQHIVGLPQNGIVDSGTWNLLVRTSEST